MYNASLQHARYLNNFRIYIYHTWIPTKCHLFWLLVYFSLHQASSNNIPISITTINQFVADHVELDGKRHASVMTLSILFTINNYLCPITHSMSYAPLLQLSHPLLYRVIYECAAMATKGWAVKRTWQESHLRSEICRCWQNIILMLTSRCMDTFVRAIFVQCSNKLPFETHLRCIYATLDFRSVQM